MLSIEPCQQDQMTFGSIEELSNDVRLNGYYGGLRLIKASVKRFYDHCQTHAIAIEPRNFTMEYRTNIPVRVGLAGSSGIVTATVRALMNFYNVAIEPHNLATLCLSVELDELAIGAGLQDRVVQAYEGVVYMDFERTLMQQRGYGRYVALDPQLLPPLFVAYHSDLSEGTEVSHNDLRSRFNRNDPIVLNAMEEFASLAQQAKHLLEAGRGIEIGPLMSENFALRTRTVAVSEGNKQLVSIAQNLGAHAKLAGSGGAVIGVYDGDPQRFKQLENAYANIGATLIHPDIKQNGAV